MRFVICVIAALVAGCASSQPLLPFSEGFADGVTLSNSLPTITVDPGEIRAVLSESAAPLGRKVSVESEDTAIVSTWSSSGTVYLRGGKEGRTFLHLGRFPLSAPNPSADFLRRSAWRSRALAILGLDPAASKSIDDGELWRRIVRSSSGGAMQVIVAKDRLQFN